MSQSAIELLNFKVKAEKRHHFSDKLTMPERLLGFHNLDDGAVNHELSFEQYALKNLFRVRPRFFLLHRVELDLLHWGSEVLIEHIGVSHVDLALDCLFASAQRLLYSCLGCFHQLGR
jgi:hypothetical protein